MSSTSDWSPERVRQAAVNGTQRETAAAAAKPRRLSARWLAAGLLVGVCLAAAWVLPGMAGPTVAGLFAAPTGTASPRPSPTSTALPTATLVPTATPLVIATLSVAEAGARVGVVGTPTSTAVPLATLLPTETQVSPTFTPTAYPVVMATPYAFEPRFVVQGGSLIYQGNDEAEGCQFMAIRGTVRGADGKPRLYYGIHLIIVDETGARSTRNALSGSRPQFGASGFQFVLGSTPMETTDRYALILQDENGMAVSDKFVIPTSSSCERNVVVVDFIEKLTE